VKHTRTIGFNASGIGVLSWKSDRQYRLVQATVVGGAILNFAGNTYAQLSVAGVHLDWILCGSSVGGVSPVTNDLAIDVFQDQIVYFSAGASASLGIIVLEIP